MANFVHLHVHSHYSMLDGMSKVPDLVDKCRKTGMNAIALTDHGNMFGVKELSDYTKKVNGQSKEDLEDLEGKLKKAAGDEAKVVDLQKQIEAQKEKMRTEVPFKPIFGEEFYCARRDHFITNEYAEKHRDKVQKSDQSGWHLILLAKNKTGYKNLCKLSSKAFTEGFYGRPRIDHKLLEEYHEGIICLSACLAGEVQSYIREGRTDEAEKAAAWFKNLFGDDYYIELQRHKTDKPNGNRETYEEQEKVNPTLIAIAKKLGIKIICTNDVHFVEEEHGEAHDRLICLSTQKNYDDGDRMHYTKQEWLKTPEEMGEIFADVPEALENTLEIADKVEFYDIDSGPIMPKFPIPEEFGTEEEYRKRFTEEDLYNEFTQNEHGEVVMTREDGEKKIKKIGGYDKLYRIKLEADYLSKLAWDGAKERYGENLDQAKDPSDSPVPPEKVKENIVFELHVMKTMGFPGYFLIVRDYIRAAREELDVSVGPGRGSAAGSVVAYCLKITNIDPLKYDLLFERFLNPDRISLPDIDVDFEDSGRGDVLDWVTQKYGAEKVAHIITYGTMATKNAIADVARVHQLPLSLSNALKGFVPDKLDDFQDPETGMTLAALKEKTGKKVPKVKLKTCFKYVPQLKAARNGEYNEDLNALPKYAENRELIGNVLKYAAELEGTIKQTGIHACGVIIGADDLTDFAPISCIRDKATGENINVTQYDGHVIESVGLIKMDFLGLITLTLIKETLRNVRHHHHDMDIDIDNIPIDDELTYKLFSAGRTIGVFQFESPGMQKYLRELQPTKLTDLIAMNALYRPGPIQYIPTFINRAQGREAVTYDLPIMEKRLKDTYGVTVYQEQVMLLSRDLANFTRGESDMLRKAMGKKQMAILAELKPKFINQAMENPELKGTPKLEETLEKIWKDWEAFASYAFNKSHAACYAWVAYQTGYLKAHFPAEYMAANLTISKDNISDVTKFMEECKAMNLAVKGPNVNESELNFAVNEEGAILFGLGGVKGVGEAAVEAIIAEREKNGKYTDIFNFVERVPLTTCNSKAIEALALAGAFDCFGERREQYFEFTPDNKLCFSTRILEYGKRRQAEKQDGQLDMFSVFNEQEENVKLYDMPLHPTLPEMDSWNSLTKLNKEREVIGMYLSSHPLDEYSIDMELLCTKTCEDLTNLMSKKEYVTVGDANYSIGSKFVVGGMVTEAKEGVSKKGNKYGRLRLEDYGGGFDFVMFGQTFIDFSKYLKTELFLLVEGEIVDRRSNWSYGKPVTYNNGDVVTPDIKITKICQMAEASKSAVKNLTMGLDIKKVDEGFCEDFARVVAKRSEESDKYRDSSVSLSVKLIDTETGYALPMYARDVRVRIDEELKKFVRGAKRSGVLVKLTT